jgi:hypothetical protein
MYRLDNKEGSTEKVNRAKNKTKIIKLAEAVFLVMCDPPMNELWAT